MTILFTNLVQQQKTSSPAPLYNCVTEPAAAEASSIATSQLTDLQLTSGSYTRMQACNRDCPTLRNQNCEYLLENHTLQTDPVNVYLLKVLPTSRNLQDWRNKINGNLAIQKQLILTDDIGTFDETAVNKAIQIIKAKDIAYCVKIEKKWLESKWNR